MEAKTFSAMLPNHPDLVMFRAASVATGHSSLAGRTTAKQYSIVMLGIKALILELVDKVVYGSFGIHILAVADRAFLNLVSSSISLREETLRTLSHRQDQNSADRYRHRWVAVALLNEKGKDYYVHNNTF
ncbi:hypothetical protein FPOAC2_04738 [Fusarium poae]